MTPLRFAAATAAAFLCCALVARATSVIPPTLDELVERSETVLRGTITDTRCEWRGEGDDRRIVTVVSVAVNETILGEPQPSLELEFLGGEIDGQRLIVTGQTGFMPGAEDILFISRQQTTLTPLVRMMFGRYLIGQSESGQRFVARDNGVPLASTEEISTALTTRPPGTVLAQIKSGRLLSPEAFAQAIRESAARAADTEAPGR